MLINIWEYNEPGCKNQCPVCIQYEKWCIEAAQEKWKAEYLDFEYVIQNLRRQNKQLRENLFREQKYDLQTYL